MAESGKMKTTEALLKELEAEATMMFQGLKEVQNSPIEKEQAENSRSAEAKTQATKSTSDNSNEEKNLTDACQRLVENLKELEAQVTMMFHGFKEELQNSGIEKEQVENSISAEAKTQASKSTSEKVLTDILSSPSDDEDSEDENYEGAVPRFVNVLSIPRDDENSGEEIKYVNVLSDHGAVPILIKLLSSPSDDVREQAVRTLGTIAENSPKCRNLILGNGALAPWLSLLDEHAKLSMLRNATQTLYSLCTGLPEPSLDQIRPALPVLRQLLVNGNCEMSIKEEVCKIIRDITSGRRERIQAVIDSEIIGPLNNLLQNAEIGIKMQAAWVLSNVTQNGTHEQIMHLESQGCFKTLYDLLGFPDPSLVSVCLGALETILDDTMISGRLR